MNKQPVYYLQTDPKWKNLPYRVSGESSTIGSAGCGPSCASMLISTITKKIFTPKDACDWSLAHGYKALNQGTYYSYFKAQFKAYNINCDMLNWVNTYGNPDHDNHKKIVEMLKEGYYIIALMNKGVWTSSGHYVVVWWADDKIRINDPASTFDKRMNGDPKTFFSQVKYYWWVDAREFNKEELNMTREEFLNKLTDKEAYDILTKASRHAATLKEPAWSRSEGHWKKAEEKKIVGGEPERFVLRDEMIAILGRLGLIK